MGSNRPNNLILHRLIQFLGIFSGACFLREPLPFLINTTLPLPSFQLFSFVYMAISFV